MSDNTITDNQSHLLFDFGFSRDILQAAMIGREIMMSLDTPVKKQSAQTAEKTEILDCSEVSQSPQEAYKNDILVSLKELRNGETIDGDQSLREIRQELGIDGD